MWEGFGVGSSFRHGEEGENDRDGGEGAAKKAKIDDNLAAVAHLAMPYTVEEEAWLRSRLDKFSAAYNEVG